MNIQKLENLLIKAGIEPNEAKAEIKILLREICGWTALDILMEKPLNTERIEEVEDIVFKRAETREPLQHLLGKAYFYGDNYKVNKDVLIPRDETEILVQKAIQIIKSQNLKDILDIGTGSGCIACSIAKNTETYVLGVDISSDALRIALENASNLNLNNKAVFRKSDIYSKLRENEKFDMIISNPPYIPKGTKLQKEVEFDPELALFTEDTEGLEFYKKIIEDADKFLKSNGFILFECGINQAQKIKQLLTSNKFGNIEIEKDLAGIERVIISQRLD